MLVALISTYDLGRQPFGLASPAAWLGKSGFEVACFDLSRAPLDTQIIRRAALVGFFLPMHTATRLVEPVVRRVREWNPKAHLCAYGLYATPNAAWLHSLGVSSIFHGEFEADLVELARRLEGQPGNEGDAATGTRGKQPARRELPRLAFRVPDRHGLPALSTYAKLQLPDGSARIVGYTEASRGCKHLCRHCPIVPVYNGQFRVVPVDVVLADVRQQVEAGAAHITFGDPDFFNGPTHALRVVEGLSTAFPDVTYDVTIKVEHLLRHARLLPALRDTGCLFVTTAVESIDDAILERFAKGHTRADFERAVTMCRDVGLDLVPTFIPFTPWTTAEGYGELLDVMDTMDLVGQVPSIQLTLRLLIPEGSALLPRADVSSIVGPFDGRALVYPWTHVDPTVDALQREAAALVRGLAGFSRVDVFDALRALTDQHAGALSVRPARRATPRPRTEVPYLNEPWYC